MSDTTTIGLTREQMAQRAALDIPNGAYVNLGIGIPELVARFVPEGREVIYHTENGLLGMGPSPEPGELEPEAVVTPSIFVHRIVTVPEPLVESELVAAGATYP